MISDDILASASEALADPVLFAKAYLRHDVWDKQAEILRAVQEHSQVVVKACHSSSKTFTAAEAALWWLARYQKGVVITTAPTWIQVEKILWGELKNAVMGSLWPFPEPMSTELRLGPNNYAMGLSTDQGVRFQGHHGTILIIMDEGVGVRPDIYEAIQGIRAGGKVHTLSIGNPTVASGPFYDAFLSTNWHHITISAFDTPNLKGVTMDDIAALPDSWDKMTEEQKVWITNDPKPYLTRRRWVWEAYNDWGPDSPSFQSRVLGRFPEEGPRQLITLADAEGAKNREPLPSLPLEAGLDVAGPGDAETCLYIRAGDAILDMKAWRIADPRGAVVKALIDRRNSLGTVKVDVTGIGHGMERHLRDMQFPTQRVNAGGAARQSSRFLNIKAEEYWGLRQRFKDGRIAGLTDGLTIHQLTSLQWGEDERGRVFIESKDQARRRGVKSPDRAEALMLAFADTRGGKFRVF